MASKKEKPLTIRMTPEEHEAFKKAAESHGWSMSWVLRRLINIFMKNHEELTPGEFTQLFLPPESDEPPPK